jgi:hypothetical protein
MTTHAPIPTPLSSRRARPVAKRTTYLGVSDWWGRHVWVERAGVRTALRYRGEHRMPGFAWGRRGLAARELSRSLIEDATGSPILAERYCRELTLDLVADLPEESFELDRDQILAWLEQHADPSLPPEPLAA